MAKHYQANYGAQGMRDAVGQVDRNYEQRLQQLQRQHWRDQGNPANRNPTTMFGREMPNMGTDYNLQRAGMQQEAERARQQAIRDQLAASELQRRDEVREQLYGLAEGRVQDLRQDPMNAAIQAELMRRITGEAQPFDDATRNALMSQAADQAAVAAGSQMAMAGGRPGDPAFESIRRQAAMQSAMGSQRAARDIDIQRQLTNYGAQGQALSQAAGINQAQQQAITDAERYLQSLLASEQFNVGMPTQEISMEEYARARGLM